MLLTAPPPPTTMHNPLLNVVFNVYHLLQPQVTPYITHRPAFLCAPRDLDRDKDVNERRVCIGCKVQDLTTPLTPKPRTPQAWTDFHLAGDHDTLGW